MRGPGGPGGVGNLFAHEPVSAALHVRCFRSASSRPARPSTTSSRARCASTRSTASATGWRSTTPAAPRRAAPGSARAACRSASPGRSTATRSVASSPALTRRTGPHCGARRARSRVAGFDLTFSAPKSVSVLFGIGDRELRGAVRTRTRPRRPRGGRISRAFGGGGPSRPWRG